LNVFLSQNKFFTYLYTLINTKSLFLPYYDIHVGGISEQTINMQFKYHQTKVYKNERQINKLSALFLNCQFLISLVNKKVLGKNSGKK